MSALQKNDMTNTSRLEHCFTALKQQNRPALVSYLTAGDPDAETSRRLLHGLPEAGVDIIELGMPFSDPMADGPAIQKAALRALGFREFRVRHHDQVARIEVARDELQRAVAESGALTAAMKEAGFFYATLDLTGFRSGSMNEALKRK